MFDFVFHATNCIKLILRNDGLSLGEANMWI
jgi:hypothetical protein